MSLLARSDQGLVSQWWWTVDRWLLICFVMLLGLGMVMTIAASPAVAQKLGLSLYFFVKKQFVFLILAFFAVIAVSNLSPTNIRRLAVLTLMTSVLGVILTIMVGQEIKGATRWLYVLGVSLQPSEFVKPSFIVVCAWLFARQNTRFESLGALYTFGMLVTICGLFMLQPDIGQMTLLAIVWACVFFLAGASLRLLAMLMTIGVVAALYVYSAYPHVASRIDRFVDPSSGDTFQVEHAMEAIASGGVFGVGPGNGRVKSILPDAHTDYVFAVAIEEGGVFLAFLILAAFAAIIGRSLWHVRKESQHWVQLAVAGLVCLFGLQVCINLAVNLNLMPSKGMTLPFISYGGSSLLASALTIGMIIGLTRRRGTIGRDERKRPSIVRIVSVREVVS